MKNITKQQLESLSEEEVVEYLKDHNLKETWEHFQVGKKALDLFITSHNIERPDKAKAIHLRAKRQLEAELTNLDVNQVLNYYKDHSDNSTKERFNITNKILNILLDSHDVKHHSKSENTIFTNLEKYGVVNVSQVEDFKLKSEQTKFTLHGNPHYVNPEKAKETNLQKWGTTCTVQSDKLKPQVEAILLKKYGAKTYFGSEVGIITSHENASKKHFLKSEYSEVYKQLRVNKNKSIEFLKENYLTREELYTMFNCTRSSVQTWIRSFNLFDYIKPSILSGSGFEREIQDYITSLNIDFIEHDRSILDGHEIDIYIPTKNIGIECNGDYWHSDLYKDKHYHENKSKLAETKGVRLIHIFQSEWEEYPEKLKSMLNIALGKTSTKIYARQCTIRLITNKEARPFNDKNHLQGHRNAKITLGLFYRNELVQLMSFSPHTKYEWEIIRGCPASNNIVVGGVSKLFKYFIKEYKPTQIFSYCDFNKFDGKGYKSLGMEFIGYTGPNKRLLMSDNSVINRSPSKYQELKKSVRAIIWGSGSKKFLWKAN